MSRASGMLITFMSTLVDLMHTIGREKVQLVLPIVSSALEFSTAADLLVNKRPLRGIGVRQRSRLANYMLSFTLAEVVPEANAQHLSVTIRRRRASILHLLVPDRLCKSIVSATTCVSARCARSGEAVQEHCQHCRHSRLATALTRFVG